MRVALAQVPCSWGQTAENLRRARVHLRTAQRQGADLVVFPESSLHGLWKDPLVRLAAEPLDGPLVSRMQEWARQHRIAVAFGLAERTAGKPYNSYVVLDSEGGVAGVHRKNYVTPLEQLYYRCDRRRPVFELCGMRVAVGICADCGHADLMDGYGRRGARLVLMPHAWDADPVLRDGRLASWKSLEEAVDHVARGLLVRYATHAEMLRRFIDRAAPFCRRHGYWGLFVNQVGRPHPLIPFAGPSFVMSPQGHVVRRSRSAAEGLLVADVQA